MDDSRPAPTGRCGDGRAPHDGECSRSARGDACRSRRPAAGAGRCARPAAVADPDSLTLPERRVRGGDVRGRSPRRGRGFHAHRVWGPVPRGHPSVPRGTACGHRTGAALPVVRRRHHGARARDGPDRPSGANHVRRSARARSVVRGAGVRRGAARRPAAVDRSVRRARRIPHVCAYAGPMFRHAIEIEPGVVVERDGFVFADILPAAAST